MHLAPRSSEIRQWWRPLARVRSVSPGCSTHVGGPLSDSFIGTEPVSVPLEAEQPQQPTRVVNDGEAPSTAPLQYGHCVLEGLMRADNTTSDSAEVASVNRARSRLAQIGSLNRGDQLAVCGNDEGHVDVVVVEQPADLGEPSIKSVGLANRYHAVGNASSGELTVIHFPPSYGRIRPAGGSNGSENRLYDSRAPVSSVAAILMVAIRYSKVS
ncbi:MAG: hypothetical protein JWM55_1884 [Acidimicrobiaceae bacterium]|nr:hypothetical protein [Acidimicrobiaceae bacterium]